MGGRMYLKSAVLALVALGWATAACAQNSDAKTCFEKGQARDKKAAQLYSALDVSHKEMSAQTGAGIEVHMYESALSRAKAKGAADIAEIEAKLGKAKERYAAIAAKPKTYNNGQLMRELEELLASKQSYREECVGKFDAQELSGFCVAGLDEADASLCDWLKKK